MKSANTHFDFQFKLKWDVCTFFCIQCFKEDEVRYFIEKVIGI